MNKKIFIFIIILFAIIASLVWFFLFYKKPIEIDSLLPNDGLFPSGNEVSTTTSGGNKEPITGTTEISRLRQVHKEPVAGATTFEGPKGTTIRFVERATGHIYETYSDSASQIRLSNTTIPKVYEALWSSTGDELLMRYLRDDNNTIRTFYTKLNAGVTENESLEGLFLDDNLRQISILDNRFFYFQNNGAETQGIIANLDGTKKTAVFTSGFGQFIPSWTTPNTVLLYTAPIANAPGSAYSINIVNGAYKKVVSDINGLTGVLNPSATKTLVGFGGGGLGISVLDLNTLQIKKLSLGTLPEKCVWGTSGVLVYCAVPKSIPLGAYPDSWYQGIVSFNDRVWKINIDTGETELIFDPLNEVSEELDVVNPKIDSEEKALLFMNKKDLSLWVYQLEI